MRWSYFFPRLLIVIFVWGFLAFGLDPLLRDSSVCWLQSTIGANADVGEFATTFFPPTLTLKNVTFAQPQRSNEWMSNFEELQLKLDSDALARRRLVVEEGWLRGLRFDTKLMSDATVGQSSELVTTNNEGMTKQSDGPSLDLFGKLTAHVQSNLDLNRLETFHTGAELYEKWTTRFQELNARIKTTKGNVRRLNTQLRKAEAGDAVQQIEQSFQVSHKVDAVAIEVQVLDDELKAIWPEICSDYQILHDVCKRDQKDISQTLSELRPDPRSISVALLEKAMHLQLKQGLSWIDAAGHYGRRLREQRGQTQIAGHVFQFQAGNSGPGLLVRKLLVTGTLSLQWCLRYSNDGSPSQQNRQDKRRPRYATEKVQQRLRALKSRESCIKPHSALATRFVTSLGNSI